MPVPTAQPQRSPVVGVGAMPASANACSAAASANRCERLANLSSLRSVASVSTVEALDLGGDARRKTARVEQRDRRGAAAACEQRIPGRGDVVADGRDQADAGNGDAAAMTDSCCGRRPWACAEFDPRGGDCLALEACADSATRSVPSSCGVASAPSSTACPGVVKARTLTLVMRRNDSGPAAAGGDSRASVAASPICASSIKRRRKHGPPRKMVAKERRRRRAPATWRASTCAGTCSVTDRRREIDAGEAMRRGAGAAEQRKALAQRLGRIEVGRRQHRAQAVHEFGDAPAVDARPARHRRPRRRRNRSAAPRDRGVCPGSGSP